MRPLQEINRSETPATVCEIAAKLEMRPACVPSPIRSMVLPATTAARSVLVCRNQTQANQAAPIPDSKERLPTGSRLFRTIRASTQNGR